MPRPSLDDEPHGPATPTSHLVTATTTTSDRFSNAARDAETPLYARSDWDEQATGVPKSGMRTGYSKGISLQTGKSGTGGLGSEDERYSSSYGPDTTTSSHIEPHMPRSRTTSPRSISEKSAGVENGRESVEEDEDERWKEEPTAWTQSSWNGPRTTLRFDDESELPLDSDMIRGSNRPLDEGRSPTMRSPYHPTAYGGSYAATPLTEASTRRDMSNAEMGAWGEGTLVESPLPESRDGNVPISAHARTNSNTRSVVRTAHRSSLPSVLSLGQLANRKSRATRRNTIAAATMPGPPPTSLPSPNAEIAPALTTAAHQRLGRMSVAPARYSATSLSPPQGHTIGPEDGSIAAKMADTDLGRWILSYRPILNSIAALVAALLLAIALGSSKGIGGFVFLQKGALEHHRGEGAVSLGVNGWCSANDKAEVCSHYRYGDFSNSASDFLIPGNGSLLYALHDFLALLTASCWLLAAFQVITTALQAVLFFGLSLPFNHLIGAQYPLTRHLQADDLKYAKIPVSEHQAEVNLRVKCETPPYDTWEWVWWAWWAHKRGPVGHVFAACVGVLSLCTLGLGIAWKRQIAAQADGGEASVEYGAGTFVSLIALILTLDSFISASRYWIHISRSLRLFTSPPDPSHHVHLPLSGKMTPRTQPGQSLFAPQYSVHPAITHPPAKDAAQELDEETIRWLAEYPNDPELGTLIHRLRAGDDHPEYILSDVGLLYLRTKGDESALLVPPRGIIRQELIEDAHLEMVESEDGTEGFSGHFGPSTMLEKLSTTFWWADMRRDVEEFVLRCRLCNAGEIEARERLAALEERPGMTAVPFTGVTNVTGWTGAPTGRGHTRKPERVGAGAAGSAMAVEMAYATRKAQEEA